MYEYPFEPTPADTEIFLSSEPLNLTKAHIASQFKDPLRFNFDYVGSYIETYRYSKLEEITDDDTNELELLNDDFVKFMLFMFETRLGIGFPDLVDCNSVEVQHGMFHMTYRYFIINIKHNFSSFCLNYIEQHRKEILDIVPRKKDVTSLNLKKDDIDADDIAIIASLSEIIRHIIFDKEHDIDYFLQNSDLDEPRLETELMIDLFDNFKITGNFYPYYRKMVDDTFLKEIECKVRNKILKKYKK